MPVDDRPSVPPDDQNSRDYGSYHAPYGNNPYAYWGTPWWMMPPPPFWGGPWYGAPYAPYYPPAYTLEDEREFLLDYKAYLEDELRFVEDRLREIEKELGR